MRRLEQLVLRAERLRRRRAFGGELGVGGVEPRLQFTLACHLADVKLPLLLEERVKGNQLLRRVLMRLHLRREAGAQVVGAGAHRRRRFAVDA